MAISLRRPHELAQLNEIQRTALLCMVLGSEASAIITQNLDRDVMGRLSYEIARMKPMSDESSQAVLAEWIDETLAADDTGAAQEYIEHVLETAFGKRKAAAILSRTQAQLSDAATFRQLRNAEPKQIIALLRGEHPQTVAVILSHLHPAHAAAVLEQLEPALASEVMVRMAKLEELSPDMQAVVQRLMAADKGLARSQNGRPAAGANAVAEMLAHIAPSMEEALMKQVRERDRKISEQIRASKNGHKEPAHPTPDVTIPVVAAVAPRRSAQSDLVREMENALANSARQAASPVPGPAAGYSTDDREELLKAAFRRRLAQNEAPANSNVAPDAIEENVAALAVFVAREILGKQGGVDTDRMGDLVRRSLEMPSRPSTPAMPARPSFANMAPTDATQEMEEITPAPMARRSARRTALRTPRIETGKICSYCLSEFPSTEMFCPNDGMALREKDPTLDIIGSVIAERYHVMKGLGEGGMGKVFLAEHVKMGRKSAVKVMSPAMMKDADAVSRFNREAANAARISHPNICSIYDFGETEEGLIYLAMEFIEGHSLSALIKQQGYLPPLRVAELIKQTSEALGAASEMGIVHRDLKPDNIMITKGRNGHDLVKVVDFGIAKATARAEKEGNSQSITKTGIILATPEYASPEQLINDTLDGRSDIYSLALVAYRALTGGLPFPGRTEHETMIMRLRDDPLPLSALKPEVDWPADVQAVLDKALARNPADRYASAPEFGHALYEAIEKMPVSRASTVITHPFGVEEVQEEKREETKPGRVITKIRNALNKPKKAEPAEPQGLGAAIHALQCATRPMTAPLVAARRIG